LANRHFQGIKPLLPRTVKRRLLVHLFGIGRESMPRPSRRWLEREVLPELPKLGFRRILFVGTAPYTWRYENLALRRGATRWVTCDVSPSAAVWGAREHVTTDVRAIGRHFSGDSFDAVLLIGVFGFGTDAPADFGAALAAVIGVLRPGGLLLVGWNTDVTPDPLALRPMLLVTDPGLSLPFPCRREFPDENFVFDFRLLASGQVAP
jgi:SAM-dependent methyltransferase